MPYESADTTEVVSTLIQSSFYIIHAKSTVQYDCLPLWELETVCLMSNMVCSDLVSSEGVSIRDVQYIWIWIGMDGYLYCSFFHTVVPITRAKSQS